MAPALRLVSKFVFPFLAVQGHHSPGLHPSGPWGALTEHARLHLQAGRLGAPPSALDASA